MKHFFFVVCLCGLFLSGATSMAQGDYTEFYPLQIGNWWHYVTDYSGNAYHVKYEITDSLQHNGHRYFQFGTDGFAVRFDTAGNFIYFNPNSGIIDTQYQFHAPICEWPEQGDSCTWSWGEEQFGWLAAATDSRRIFKFNGLIWEEHWLKRGIGLDYKEVELTNTYLVGAVVNGVAYGDTAARVGIHEAVSPPLALQPKLYENYPNPFNARTTITFHLPKQTAVTVAMYNLAGRRVCTLIQTRIYAPGTHQIQWDGINQQGEAVSSGIYVYRLTTPKFVETKKLVLLQ